MTDMDDCTRYQDWLAAPVEPAPGDRERLERHADSCRQCSAIRRLHQRVQDALSGDLEAQVPDELVAEMWPRVRAARAAARRPGRARSIAVWWAGDRSRTAGPPGPASLGMPLIAAAVIVLLLVTGWLASERSRLMARERDLLRRIDQVESRSDSGVQAAGASLPRTARAAWPARVDQLTASHARAWLAQLPPDTLLLNAQAADRLCGDLFPARGLVRRALPQEVDLRDGLQAREALAVVDRVLAERPELARAHVWSLRRAVGL